MGVTQAKARQVVERLNLIGPAHGTVPGDFERVRAALEDPLAVAALNALDAGRMEETPQGAAAHRGCREILELMLARGVRLDLFMACALGFTQEVAAFLREEPRRANARGAHGIHVLNHALDAATARVLLDHGAELGMVVYAPWGWTPVHEAAAMGRRGVLELLVERGGSVGQGPRATTPLHAAARNGHAGVVQWLLVRGSDAGARGAGGPWEGKTPLAVARDYGHEEVAVLLGG